MKILLSLKDKNSRLLQGSSKNISTKLFNVSITPCLEGSLYYAQRYILVVHCVILLYHYMLTLKKMLNYYIKTFVFLKFILLFNS